MISLKKFRNYLVDSFLLSHISEAIQRDLLLRYTADKLFYDVANFAIYNQVPGDYLEFGVWQGDGFAQMYRRLLYQCLTFEGHARIFKNEYDPAFFSQKRFFAFDSFEGLPQAVGQDTPVHFATGGTYQSTEQKFRSNIQQQGVDLSKVVIVPGWFDKSLTSETKQRHKLTQACVIFIDCDLYESAVPIFAFISSLVQDGTVIIMDDYFRYKGNPQRGLRRAFQEWLDRSPAISVSELSRCSANRVAFICHLKE
jgi:O-methyltransferase